MMIVQTWHDPDRRLMHVAVILQDGSRHTRTLDQLDDERDLRIAEGFWRHAQLVAGLELTDHFTREQRAAAVLTEQCLAVEQLFPHLRERLPY